MPYKANSEYAILELKHFGMAPFSRRRWITITDNGQPLNN